MKTVKARIGRPPNPPEPGKRSNLTTLVSAGLKSKLLAAADAQGRTQSQEAEARLEASFKTESLLPEILALRYGEDLASLLLLVGEAARCTAVALKGVDLVEDGEWPDPNTPGFWLKDPALFAEVQRAIVTTLAKIAPAGEPQKLTLDYAGDAVRDVFAGKVDGTSVASAVERLTGKEQTDGHRS